MLLFPCPAFCADGPRPVDDVYKLLMEKNIPFDVDKTRRATVEGVIKAVDPGAVILTATQFHELLLEKSVEKNEEWPEGICYLKIKGIYRDAAENVADRIRKWKEEGKTGAILDLRSAGGESMSSVDKIAKLYVTADPLLYQVKDYHGKILETHRLRFDEAPLGDGMPLMLLVNESTVEASEILAAILKGRQGVTVVGSRTKGDPGIRENIKLGNDEIIHITTKQAVVNGSKFETTGVQPDVAVAALQDSAEQKIPDKSVDIKVESEKAREDRKLMERVYGDPVLLRATDILLGLKATTSYGSKTATNTPSPAGVR